MHPHLAFLSQVLCPGKGDIQKTRAEWALLDGQYTTSMSATKSATAGHTAVLEGAVVGVAKLTDQTAESPIAAGKGGPQKAQPSSRGASKQAKLPGITKAQVSASHVSVSL